MSRKISRESKLLLRLLYVTVMVPLVFFLVTGVREWRENRSVINSYVSVIEKSSGNIFGGMTGNGNRTEAAVDKAVRERDELLILKDRLLSGYFDPEDFSFFDFTNFVRETGEESGILIENYRTGAEASPRFISISARGGPEEIAGFLYNLETCGMVLPVPRLSISLDQAKGEYNLNITVNCINRYDHLKERER